MTNKKQTQKHSTSLLDVPIKDNPHVYFNGEQNIASEVAKHIKANPSKYYALILPAMSFCSGCGEEEMFQAIATNSRSVEFLVGNDCCSNYRESMILVGKEGGPQKTVGFYNLRRQEYETGKIPKINPEYTLKEILEMSKEILDEKQKEGLNQLEKYLATIEH